MSPNSPGDPQQLDLFSIPPPPPVPPAPAPLPVAPTGQRARIAQDVAIDLVENDIYGRWFAFHLANPHAYRILRDLALEARRVEGRERFGIGALNEVARWYKRYSTEGEPYKMPDNFRSMYARMLMEQEPLLAGFFREHRLRTATWPTDPDSVSARTASLV